MPQTEPAQATLSLTQGTSVEFLVMRDSSHAVAFPMGDVARLAEVSTFDGSILGSLEEALGMENTEGRARQVLVPQSPSQSEDRAVGFSVRGQLAVEAVASSNIVELPRLLPKSSSFISVLLDDGVPTAWVVNVAKVMDALSLERTGSSGNSNGSQL